MKLALPFTEAVSLATAGSPLPPVIRSLECRGETLHAEIDPELIPTRSITMQLAAIAAGTVAVTARLAGYSQGVATFVVSAHARSLPVHKLLPFLIDPVTKAMRERGLPEGLLQMERGDAGPLMLVNVQKALETKATGMTLTDLRLLDGEILAEAAIGTVILHRTTEDANARRGEPDPPRADG